MQDLTKTYASGWEDYELIDAGGGKKLERWGKIITIRPELQAYFKSELPFTEWKKLAHLEFIETKGQAGHWKEIQKAPKTWDITYKKITIKSSELFCYLAGLVARVDDQNHPSKVKTHIKALQSGCMTVTALQKLLLFVGEYISGE